ncbi:MAG: carbohydrate ABC transporter permease [Candidatus Nanopelagicaceae bacterium]|nr:carbohydrate ABC transporter permease [Candidatus Nanopelagicaceae bacterium]
MNKLLLTLKYVTIALWSSFVVAPFLWALTTSFKSTNGVINGPTYIPWVQYEPTLNGWKNIFGGAGGINIVHPYIDSIMVTFFSTIISLSLGALAAYGLSRFTYKFGPMKNADIIFFFVSQRVMPPIVLVIPFFILLAKLKLLDTIIGLVFVTNALLLPIVVWVLVDFFNNIPRQIDEMAMMEGCTPFETFRRVILPNSLPGLTVAGMFCVIFGWNDFFFAFTLTFTKVQTLPVSIVALNSSVTPWWTLSASALAAVTPLILLAIFVERYLSRGGLAGAVK